MSGGVIDYPKRRGSFAELMADLLAVSRGPRVRLEYDGESYPLRREDVEPLVGQPDCVVHYRLRRLCGLVKAAPAAPRRGKGRR